MRPTLGLARLVSTGTQSRRHTMIRILLVDDEPTILSTIATMLRMENYDVATACDGREALDSVLAHGPDLIITDYNMPRMNGQQLLDAVRDTPSTAMVPVLMLSGNTAPRPSPAGVAQTPTAYLIKPFTRAQLLGVLHTLLNPLQPPTCSP